MVACEEEDCEDSLTPADQFARHTRSHGQKAGFVSPWNEGESSCEMSLWNEGEAVRAAGKNLRVMLLAKEGPVPGLWPVWNAAVGAKAPGDAGWLPKVTRGSKSLDELQWVQASRLAMALARMRDLPVWEAETEDRWQVLAMQRVKLGFP